MKRVLLIGLDPETVDFSDPALPPGMDAAKIAAGIRVALDDFRSRGWEGDHLYIQPGGSAAEAIKAYVSGKTWDCIVIGGGVRLPPRNLHLFEQVLNAVSVAAPGIPVAFNTTPVDSGAAAARWIG